MGQKLDICLHRLLSALWCHANKSFGCCFFFFFFHETWKNRIEVLCEFHFYIDRRRRFYWVIKWGKAWVRVVFYQWSNTDKGIALCDLLQSDLCVFCPEMTFSIPHQGVTLQTKSLHMECMPSSWKICLLMLISSRKRLVLTFLSDAGLSLVPEAPRFYQVKIHNRDKDLMSSDMSCYLFSDYYLPSSEASRTGAFCVIKIFNL